MKARMFVRPALNLGVLDGALAPGAKLPATRALSKSLGVARDTVENAYVQLHRDGFIVRQAGSGSYVSEAVGVELRGVIHRRGKRQTQTGTTSEQTSRMGKHTVGTLLTGQQAQRRARAPFPSRDKLLLQ